MAVSLKFSSPKQIFRTSVIAAHGPLSSADPRRFTAVVPSLQLSQGFLEENILDDDRDEVGEADKGAVFGGGLASLQYIEEMHLTTSSESLSGVLRVLLMREAPR